MIKSIVKTNPKSSAKCGARIIVCIDNTGDYVIEHSHDVSPSRAKSLKGNRKINMQAKRMIDINNDGGVRVNKTYQSLVQGVGGYDTLSYSKKDVSNYMQRNLRTIREEGDVAALIGYFGRMKEQNRNFFYDI